MRLTKNYERNNVHPDVLLSHLWINMFFWESKTSLQPFVL